MFFRLGLKNGKREETTSLCTRSEAGHSFAYLGSESKPFDSSCHCQEHQLPIMINTGMKRDVFLQLVNFLWNTILDNIDSYDKIVDIIDEPFQLLFNAAVAGNFGFLSELLSAHPSLIWEMDNNGRSIIHTAVSHRHASIVNLVHEIGSHKDLIVTYFVEEGNTLLHLAAKLAPRGQLELVSGAAFQMCLELIWFEVIKEMDPKLYDVSMQV
ncbi:Ankyrin-1 protein [Spatholobus suberectus]|nr:Ankyrin-1 protein [Spatholobus suberectus]